MDYDEVVLCENCEAELECGEENFCDDCLEETEDENGYCYPCRGTGEGQHESQRCSACKGTGIELKAVYDDNYDSPDDYEFLDFDDYH